MSLEINTTTFFLFTLLAYLQTKLSFACFAALKKEVKACELRNQRLKEVFAKKIQEFREACYRLTGYQINNPAENQYNLMSMYAETSTDVLLFQVRKTLYRLVDRQSVQFDSNTCIERMELASHLCAVPAIHILFIPQAKASRGITNKLG